MSHKPPKGLYFDIPLSSVYNKGMAEIPSMPIIINLERTEKMEKIASFTIDHIKLKPGVYVSRKDHVGAETITTFDLRMTSPNDEPVMNTAEVHTIEHLGATFLRNHPVFGSKTVYFGPMGCRTGFYLLLAGDYESKDIVDLVKEMFIFIRDFKGEVPGATPKDCGNYLDMNLGMANYLAKKYLDTENLRVEVPVSDPEASVTYYLICLKDSLKEFRGLFSAF